MVSYDAKLSESNIPPSKLWNKAITLLLTAASRKLSKGTESSRRGWRCRIGGTAFDFSGRSNALSRVRVPLGHHPMRLPDPSRADASAIGEVMCSHIKAKEHIDFGGCQRGRGNPRSAPAAPGAVGIHDLLFRPIVGDVPCIHFHPIARVKAIADHHLDPYARQGRFYPLLIHS